jgi:flagellar hook-associated protein 2
MGTVPSPNFEGHSKYASDLQQVLTRAISIAALPLQQLQNTESTFTAQQSALNGLSSVFGSLQSALQGIGSAAGNVTATVSNSSAIQANTSSNALPGTYSIQVDSLGSFTTTLSNAGAPVVTDPSTGNISPAASYTLTINGTPTTITPSGTSLVDLANAINAAGLGAQATVINVGSNQSPDYRLSVTSSNLAADTIQLNDGTNDLLNTLSTGTPATYQVNGLATVLQSNTRQVTLAPGLTVTMLQQTASPETITLAQDSNSLSNSLSKFATAYNAAVDALAQQHGKDAGVLAGQSLILSLNQTLSSINQYTPGSGPLTSLADIGLDLDSSGHITFDPTALSVNSLSSIQQFLGSTASGGFLKAANDALTSITDSTSGMIQSSLSSLQDQISRQNDLISQEQDRINNLATSLQAQLSTADATLAVLDSQVTFMTNLFTTMNANNSAKLA